MIKKLKNKSGETITEVLVASLLVALAVVLFAMMVSASFRIIDTSERAMKDFYKAESDFEMSVNQSGGEPGTFKGNNNLAYEGDLTSVSIKIYSIEGIAAYKKN